MTRADRLAHLLEKGPRLHGYGGVLAVLLTLLVVGATVIALLSRPRDRVARSFVWQPERHHRMPSRRLALLLEKRPRLHGYGGVLAVLLALLVVGATVIALSSQAREQVTLSFVRQPEKYTELYFSGDGAQASFGSDWVVVKIAFTVVNHEGERTSFPYVVQVVNAAEAPLGRARGSVDLTDGMSLTTIVVVVISATEAWAAVEVDLEGRSERIRFLASQMNGTGG